MNNEQRKHLPILIAGDAIAITFIIWVGRISHAESMFDMGHTLFTAAPFLISWFLVMPFVGLFRMEVAQNWRQLIGRMLLGWSFIGLPLGLVLRTLFLGRDLANSFIPVFALIMLLTTTTTLLVWRLGYWWWCNRQTPQQGLSS